MKMQFRDANLIDCEPLLVYTIVCNLFETYLYPFAGVGSQIYAFLHPLWPADPSALAGVPATPIRAIGIGGRCVAALQCCPVQAISGNFNVGVIIIALQVEPGSKLKCRSPASQPGQIKAAGQCTVHIVVTIAPPFIPCLVRIIADYTHKRCALKTNRESAASPLSLEIIVLSGILVHLVEPGLWIALNFMLRCKTLQVNGGVAISTLASGWICHKICDEPLMQHI